MRVTRYESVADKGRNMYRVTGFPQSSLGSRSSALTQPSIEYVPSISVSSNRTYFISYAFFSGKAIRSASATLTVSANKICSSHKNKYFNIIHPPMAQEVIHLSLFRNISKNSQSCSIVFRSVPGLAGEIISFHISHKLFSFTFYHSRPLNLTTATRKKVLNASATK